MLLQVLGSMLKLNTETIYQSVQQALHTTISQPDSQEKEKFRAGKLLLLLTPGNLQLKLLIEL